MSAGQVGSAAKFPSRNPQGLHFFPKKGGARFARAPPFLKVVNPLRISDGNLAALSTWPADILLAFLALVLPPSLPPLVFVFVFVFLFFFSRLWD